MSSSGHRGITFAEPEPEPISGSELAYATMAEQVGREELSHRAMPEPAPMPAEQLASLHEQVDFLKARLELYINETLINKETANSLLQLPSEFAHQRRGWKYTLRQAKSTILASLRTSERRLDTRMDEDRAALAHNARIDAIYATDAMDEVNGLGNLVAILFRRLSELGVSSDAETKAAMAALRKTRRQRRKERAAMAPETFERIEIGNDDSEDSDSEEDVEDEDETDADEADEKEFDAATTPRFSDTDLDNSDSDNDHDSSLLFTTTTEEQPNPTAAALTLANFKLREKNLNLREQTIAARENMLRYKALEVKQRERHAVTKRALQREKGKVVALAARMVRMRERDLRERDRERDEEEEERLALGEIIDTGVAEAAEVAMEEEEDE